MLPKPKRSAGGRFPHSSEAQIQDAICRYLSIKRIPHSITDASRCWTRVGKVGRSRVAPGWPDITACVPVKFKIGENLWNYPWAGLFLAIEVKAKNGQVRKVQRLRLDELKRAGAIVIVARSVEDVMRVIP